MSLSGNQKTGVGHVQIRVAYAVFTAKETATGVVLGQGGTLIRIEATPRVLYLSATPILIDIDSN